MITYLIDGLPNQNMPQTEFDAAVAGLMTDLPPWAAEVNAVQADVAAKQGAAAASAGAAAASAGAASGSAAAAADSAGDAQLDAAVAVAAASAAATSATASANSALALTASSTTSNVLGSGTKTFTVQAGRQFVPNVPIYAATSADPTIFMYGTVQSYSGTTLVMNSEGFQGAGSSASWNITVAGARGAPGPTGGVNGGSLLGQLVERKAPSIAAAATVDVWSLAGNSAALTGTATVTSFGTAPQAGAKFTLIAAAATLLTNGANLVLPGGLSYTTEVDDRVDIYADSTTRFIVSITKKDGTAVTAPAPYNRSELLTSSGTFVARVTGWHKFTLKGADGSGGAANTAGANQAAAAASGGAGGGLAIRSIFCLTGAAYTFTAGAPGAGVLRSNGAGALGVNGNAGGTSTVTGTGLSLTANGGAGGNAAITSTLGQIATAAGAVGGAASGGQINIQGANSGAATAICSPASTAGNGAATGGVAMPWRGGRYSSGAASVVTSGVSNGLALSGGSGVGGASGDAINTAAVSGGISVRTSGGGSRGASASVTSSTTVIDTNVGAGAPSIFTATYSEPPFNLVGAGGPPTVAAPGEGGGSGALIDADVAAPGVGAGVGAMAARSNTGFGAPNGRFGSSGGAVTVSTGQITTGNGGSAFLLVEFTV